MLTTLHGLEEALARGEREVTWLVHPASWFDLVPAARRATAAGAQLRFAARDAANVMPLASVPIVDLAGAYEAVREWWRELAGEQRPAALTVDAHERLVEELRRGLIESADRVLGGAAQGDGTLALPPPDHTMLADDALAMRCWHAFLAGPGSASQAAYAVALAANPEATAWARTRAWLRLVLQRQLARAWQPDVHRLLRDTYAKVRQRPELLAIERRVATDAGLEWLADHLGAELGLATPTRRGRPFKVPDATSQRPEPPTAAAKVTVLIPSFRHEAFVAETIRSVLGQTLTDIRVLVVDDASPDATAARARAIDDPRLEVHVNGHNLGLGNSVLAALDRVTTPFVALLNSDDLFHPRRLEQCIAALEGSPRSQLVSTGLTLIDPEGRRLTPDNTSALFDGHNVRQWVEWYERTRPRAAADLDLFGALLERNFLATSSNLVCRTDWLRGHSAALRSLKFCLDWQLFLDAAREDELVWLPEELVAYRLHPGNTVWFEDAKRWIYSLEVNRVAAQAIRDHLGDLPPDSRERAERAMRDLADHVRSNTETDWTGLYLNELIGGFELERHCHEVPAIAGRVAELERAARRGGRDEVARAQLRADVLEAKWRATRDQVYGLQGLAEWQRARIEADSQRHVAQERQLNAVHEELARASGHAAELHARWEQLRPEHDRISSALTELQREAVENTTLLTDLRAELERSAGDLRSARDELAVRTAALETMAAALARTTADLATAEAALATSREERARTLTAVAAAEQRTERLQQDLDAANAASQRERDAARTAVARARASQRDLAEQVARLQRESAAAEGTWVRWRGTRLRPGNTSLRLLRRLAKWRRKLGALAAGLAPRWASWQVERPGLITTAPAPTADTWRELAPEAAAVPRPIVVRDGAALRAPAEPRVPGEIRAWSFPERHGRLWRTFAGRRSAACAELLEQLCAATRLDAAGGLARLGPHLTFAHAARRSGPAVLCAAEAADSLVRVAVAAAVTGLPWAAAVADLAPHPDPAVAWARQRLRHAGLVIARSAALRDALVAGGVAAERVVVQPGPLLPFTAGGPSEGTPLAIAAAPVDFDAGWDDLITAASLLQDRGTRLPLLLAGTIAANDHDAIAGATSVRSRIAAAGLAVQCAFSDPAAALQPLPLGNAVLIAPWHARSGPAAIDRGVLTAMAAGAAIVASDVPAIRAAVRHEHEALLVPAGDLHGLAAAWQSLATNPARRRELGARARARYVAELAPERTRAELGARLRALLTG